MRPQRTEPNPNKGFNMHTQISAKKVAADWIQDAVKRPGRVRKYLGVPEGEKIPMGELDAAIAKLEGNTKNDEEVSLLRALLLAKRFKTKDI